MEEDNQVLTANFTELKTAQARFAESSACMGALAGQAEGALGAAAAAAAAARPTARFAGC